MLHDLYTAFADLRRPQVLISLIICVLIGIAVLAMIPWLTYLAFHGFEPSGISWIDWIIKALATGGGTVLAFLLFPVLMTALIGLVAEPLLDPIERDYQDYLPPLRPVSLATALLSSLKLLVITSALSLVALLFFWTGISLFIAWVVNSYLLSREFVTMVAMRRLPEAKVDDWRRRNREAVMFRGGVIAGLFAVPVLNLVAPIVSAAMISHWLQRTDIYEQDQPKTDTSEAALTDPSLGDSTTALSPPAAK